MLPGAPGVEIDTNPPRQTLPNGNRSSQMLYLKACPRCRGDVRFAIDADGPFVQCLQCGFRATSAHRERLAAGTPAEAPRPARVPDVGEVHAAS